jgi:hypothetical protein
VAVHSFILAGRRSCVSARRCQSGVRERDSGAQESKRNCEVARNELCCCITHIPFQRKSSMAKKRAAKKSRKSVRKAGKKKGGRKKK